MDDDHKQLASATNKSKTCPNCGNDLFGQFCYVCGQNQKPPDRLLFTIINESFDDIFGSDSKTGRTLFSLWFKPVFLTNEYFAGRRAKYIQPFRLYLITSIFFFAFLSVFLVVAIRPSTIKQQANITPPTFFVVVMSCKITTTKKTQLHFVDQ